MKVKTIAGAVIGLLVMGFVSAVLFPPGRPQYRLGERLHAQSQFRKDPSETNRKAVIEYPLCAVCSSSVEKGERTGKGLTRHTPNPHSPSAQGAGER
jgi:hypothetical protein